LRKTEDFETQDTRKEGGGDFQREGVRNFV